MTRAEALKAMVAKKPVIYTGKGSMGRPQARVVGRTLYKFRGSKNSIGIITKVRQTTAIVESRDKYTGTNYTIKDLHLANSEELKGARAINRKDLPNLSFSY